MSAFHEAGGENGWVHEQRWARVEAQVLKAERRRAGGDAALAGASRV